MNSADHEDISSTSCVVKGSWGQFNITVTFIIIIVSYKNNKNIFENILKFFYKSNQYLIYSF